MSQKVGGQAVLEGVMLKSENAMSVAVRKSNGEIALKLKDIIPASKKSFIFRVPFLRGFFQLFSLLILGFEALKFSVDVLEDTEEKTSKSMFAFSAMLAIGFTILFFFVLPLYIAEFSQRYFEILNSKFWFNFFEGFVRLFLFLSYLFCISLMSDIRRVFEYHGAEHKVISAYEHNEVLIPENVKKYSRFHPRCGTSFMILVVLVSILFFSLVRSDYFIGKLLIRLIAFPILSGMIFELLKFEKIKWLKFIFVPGILLQYLTTREPSLEQIEVAIKAHSALKIN